MVSRESDICRIRRHYRGGFAAAANGDVFLEDAAASPGRHLVHSPISLRVCDRRVKSSDQAGWHGWAVRNGGEVGELVLPDHQLRRLGVVHLLGRSRAVLWGVSFVRRSW